MAVHVAVPAGAQAEGAEAPAAGLQGLEAGAQARAEVEAEVELVAQVEPEAQAGPEAEAEREEPEEQVVAAEQAAPADSPFSIPTICSADSRKSDASRASFIFWATSRRRLRKAVATL